MANKIFGGFISILTGKLGVIIISLLTTPILVRLLGSSSYGTYAFVLSVFGILRIIVNAGITDGIRKYIAESRDQRQWKDQVFGFYLRISIIISVSASLMMICISVIGVPDGLLTRELTEYFYFIALMIIAHQIYSVAHAGLMGLGREDLSEPLRVTKRALFSGTALLLVYIGYDVSGALVGHVFGSVVASIVGLVAVSKYVNLKAVVSRAPSSLPKKNLLSFNFMSILLLLLTSSLYHVDILLLQPLAGSQATGYYRAALVVAEFLWLVPISLQTVLLHSSSELWSEGDTNRLNNLISKVTRYNIMISLLLLFGVASLAESFVPLYFGDEFSRSIQPLLLLLPGAFGFAIARPIFAVGQGRGNLRVLVLATGGSALLNLVLNLLLIPTYGMTGASIATSISYLSMLIVHVLAARYLGYNPIADLRLTRLIVVSLISGPVIFGLSMLIKSDIVSLLIVPPVGFLLFSLLSLKLDMVNQDDIDELQQKASGSLSFVFD